MDIFIADNFAEGVNLVDDLLDCNYMDYTGLLFGQSR